MTNESIDKRIKRIIYQDEKIRYHEEMIKYYSNLEGKDDWSDQIAYHARLVKYHERRRCLIIRGA